MGEAGDMSVFQLGKVTLACCWEPSGRENKAHDGMVWERAAREGVESPARGHGQL